MNDDEIDLMKRAKRGDPTATAQLVKQHEGFLRKMASRWCARGRYDVDDCFQEAALGLLWAVQRFDINRGNKFLTYAGHWVRKFLGEMRYTRTVIRIKRGVKNDANQDDRNRAASVGSLRFPAFVSKTNRDIELVDSKEFAMAAVKLDPRRRSIFWRRIAGEPVADIAKSKGISRQAVSKAELEAISRVSAELNRLYRNGDQKPREVRFESVLPPPSFVDCEFLPLLEVVTPKYAGASR